MVREQPLGTCGGLRKSYFKQIGAKLYHYRERLLKCLSSGRIPTLLVWQSFWGANRPPRSLLVDLSQRSIWTFGAMGTSIAKIWHYGSLWIWSQPCWCRFSVPLWLSCLRRHFSIAWKSRSSYALRRELIRTRNHLEPSLLIRHFDGSLPSSGRKFVRRCWYFALWDVMLFTKNYNLEGACYFLFIQSHLRNDVLLSLHDIRIWLHI